MILGYLRERHELWLLDDITVLVADFLALHLDKSSLVHRPAVDVELHSVGFSEVDWPARTVAWHGVEVVRTVLSVFAALVECRVCDIQVALGIGSSQALEVRLAFGANADICLDLSSITRVLVCVVGSQEVVSFLGNTESLFLLLRRLGLGVVFAHVIPLSLLRHLSVVVALCWVRLL